MKSQRQTTQKQKEEKNALQLQTQQERLWCSSVADAALQAAARSKNSVAETEKETQVKIATETATATEKGTTEATARETRREGEEGIITSCVNVKDYRYEKKWKRKKSRLN